jgi:predicted amidohydrolase YtcJ
MRLVLSLAFALAAGASLARAAETADVIYFGGPIVTVNDAQPSAEAVAVRDGKIVAVGSRADVLAAHKGEATKLQDLAGHTMIPGLIDAHGHVFAVGVQSISANLLPPPDGSVNSIAQLQNTMRAFLAASPVVKAYGLGVGFDYDDAQLAERRHPTRDDLDAISTEIPIVVTHQSGHLGAYNSKALEMAGITAATKDPQGGVIRRRDNGEPNGVMEENAHFMTLLKLLPKLGEKEITALAVAGAKTYARFGYTTAQEGAGTVDWAHAMEKPENRGQLDIDVVFYPLLAMLGDDPLMSSPLVSRQYDRHFRIGGVKVVLDGSPQGRTAWLTQPFYKAPDGQKQGYAGYGSFTDDQLKALMTTAYRNNWQLLAHSNGDAASDQLLRTVDAVSKEVPGKDRRTVLIHGQVLRPDQVDRIKALDVSTSLFPMHTYYWGDWHREVVLGPERAENISPTGWFLDRGMIFTSHHDAPVTFPNSMRVLAATVNRTTRSGYVLGPQHRVDPLVALKAQTLWAARQYFEEGRKGSIETGKLADFVILSDNPLTIARDKIADIAVLETIKEGRSVYSAGDRKGEADPDCAASTVCARHFLAFRAVTLTQAAHSPLVAQFGAPPHAHLGLAQ